MLDKPIRPAKKLMGEIKVPGSKSYTHRVLAAAALATGETLIINPSRSEANERMMYACKNLGATITEEGNNWRVTGFGGCPCENVDEINIKNSGTALRLAISLASLAKDQTITITGDDSLKTRPNIALITALNNLGAKIKGTMIDDEVYAPITVEGRGLKGGKTTIDGTKSSQYLSSLLLVSPFAESDTTIEVEGTIVSKDYISMTLEVLDKFGVKMTNHDYKKYSIPGKQSYISPKVYEILGDYSQAAFPLAAACLIESDVTVKGLSPNDKQGDKRIIEILGDMGARIEVIGNDYRVRGPFDLEGVDVDLINTPDLFPVLAVLGIYAKGKMRLYNMPQIRFKETDRIAVMQRELTKCGVRVEDEFDEMTVYHKDNLRLEKNHVFSSRGQNHGVTDHRVAMALSIIAMRSGPAIIEESKRVEISYPDYFTDMESLCIYDDDSSKSTRTGVVAERMAM